MSAQQNERERSPRGKKITLWASVIVLVLIAGMAALILTNPANNDSEASGPVGEPSPAASPAAKEGCDVPPGDTSSKPKMPKDLRWEARNGWTWPVSDTYGPTQKKDGYGVCFARSPLGAALMGFTVLAEGNTRNAVAATELYVMDSPGKEVQLKAASSDSPATDPERFSGFIVDSFSDDDAQITLVFANANSPTGYIGVPETFRWVEGDWKLKPLDNGEIFVGKALTPAAGDFVKWGKPSA